MNAIAKTIEGLAIHGADEVVIHVGPDQTPVTFVRAGTTLWLADCLTPDCRGLLETDNTESAPAICMECENRLDAEMVASEAAPSPKVHSLIPVPARPSSLSLVAPAPGSKLPAPKHQDQRPVYIPPPTPQCKHCGKYVAPDNSSGIIPHSCGDCRDARAMKSTTHTEDHRCRSCNESLEGYHISTVYCSGCSRGRSWLQQSAKNKKKAKERMASRVCQRCQTKPLGANAHSSTKYCAECRPIVAVEKQRDQTARYNAKKKVHQQKGDQA